MGMKFLAAERVGDILIVWAHLDAFPEKVVEMRAPIGPTTAKPGAVEAGVIRIRTHLLNVLSMADWSIEWLTEAQVTSVCDLIGCHPLPTAPHCHIHFTSMDPLTPGAWECPTCAPKLSAKPKDDALASHPEESTCVML